MEARAHLRHSLRLDNRDGFHWNRTREENVSLIKGTYGALKKGNILPWKRANRRISPLVSARERVISLESDPRQLASEKQRTFQSEPISGSPDAELPAREAESRICTILRRIYPKAGLKAKLNSTIMATFILHTPPKQFKVFRSLGYCRLLKTLKGVLLTLKKDKILIGPNNI